MAEGVQLHFIRPGSATKMQRACSSLLLRRRDIRPRNRLVCRRRHTHRGLRTRLIDARGGAQRQRRRLGDEVHRHTERPAVQPDLSAGRLFL
jgi:hypothetical protein